MKLIFLGSPGVGKGSIAKEIIKKFKIPQIAAGDLSREFILGNSELAKKAKEYYDSGSLIPDEIFLEILKRRLSSEDCKNGFILDGFPRTIPQAKFLDKEIKIDRVLKFNVSDETILLRLSGRRICDKCGAIYHLINIKPKVDGECDNCEGKIYQRNDDNEEAVKKRLEVYKEKTAPLVDYYKDKGILSEVDVEGDLSKNVEDTLKVLKDYFED